MSTSEIAQALLALGVLLLLARALGEIVQKFGQPAVLGEILAGVLLGPTVFGAVFPGAAEALFPKEGSTAIFIEGFSVVAITLFLVVAGLEVDLSTIWRQGRMALFVGLGGIAIPFALGFIPAYFSPRFLGMDEGADVLVFALFFATALSISALPVIAKTLMDLNLYRTDIGMIIVAAAIFNDLIGWIIFAIILGLMGTGKAPLSIELIIVFTLLFTVFMLTVARWIFHRILPWLQAHTSWPGSVVSFGLGIALLCAAFTEWLGIHAIFGSFLVGVALGESPHLRQRTRAILHDFISYIFAPLFFATIGLKVDFVANFDLMLVLIVLAIACVGKILGCGVSARLGGMEWRQSWVVGFGMNARGTMEIILGLLALQFGLIKDKMFVALVIMALVTSMMSGPAIMRLLKRPKVYRIVDHLSAKTFEPKVPTESRTACIRRLSNIAAESAGIDPQKVADAVLRREELMPTGIGKGVAIPHARLEGLKQPIVAAGLSQNGVDFDAPDGDPANLIFLILTPVDNTNAQIDLLADIGRTFEKSDRRQEILECQNYTEFRALLRMQEGEEGH